jgi:glutathione S-transferase
MSKQQPTLILCELTDPGIDGLESYSPFCLKAHRALRAAGLRYESRRGDAPHAFKRLNPTGQVPVLLVDGEPVADSTAILQRIDALTGALTRGLDAGQRAEAWLWEELADSALNGFLVSARWADERNWQRVRECYFGAAPWFVQRIVAPRLRKQVVGAMVARDVWRRGAEACWARFQTTLDQLEARAPQRGFWLNDTVTVADVALFAQLHSLRTPLTPFQREQLANRARLSAYLDRVDAATRSRQPSSSASAAARGAGVAHA